MTKFKSQFNSHPDYGFPENYFQPTAGNSKHSLSQFDRDSNKILDGFASYFSSRDSYLETFSSLKWSQLSISEKEQHRLSECKRFYELHEKQQMSFPIKPYFKPEPKPKPVVIIDQEAFQEQGIKKFTGNIISELDLMYTNQSSTSFSKALVTTPSFGFQKRKTSTEKQNEKRKMLRACTKEINQHFADKAAITMLAEGESKRKYHRKRLAQSFCSPEEQPNPKKIKKHSPNFDNVVWSKAQLETTLQNLPSNIPINWSQLGREHCITGGNAGQVAKEFAKEKEIDISMSTPKRKPTRRPSKKNFLAQIYLFLATHL